MRQIITLEKEIAFKTMVGEITSISLEPDLAFINDSEIEGNLVISGTYKMTEASTLEEEFNYKIPVEIMLTTALDEEKRKIDINNFTYAIVNEEALEVKVEVLIEGLEKIDVDVIEEDSEEVLEEESEEEVLDEEKVELLEDVREESLDEESKEDNIEVLKTEDEETNDDILPSFDDMSNKINEEQATASLSESGGVEVMTNNENNKEVMDSIFSAFANTEETYATYSVYILREDDNLEEVMAKYKTNRDTLAEYNDLDNLKIGTKLIIPTTITEANEG